VAIESQFVKFVLPTVGTIAFLRFCGKRLSEGRLRWEGDILTVTNVNSFAKISEKTDGDLVF
jgi:hypothetical protein